MRTEFVTSVHIFISVWKALTWGYMFLGVVSHQDRANDFAVAFVVVVVVSDTHNKRTEADSNQLFNLIQMYLLNEEIVWVCVRAFVLHFIYDLVWVTFDLYTIHICKYVYFPIVQWIYLAWLKIALRKCHILTFSLIYPLVTLTRWLWTRRSVKHIPTNSTISIGSKQFPHG